ncbi:NUMOD4 motif-containing HNH endonuclease [Salana multivorans]|uniref:NUMOD4 motif-containing HNH endonuclease n=1 Tax=Salana multivorans TaxID=120377 RepID=UPI001B87B108
MVTPVVVPTPETWLPVVGYEGLYEVSDRGRVRSLDRLSAAGAPQRGRVLRPSIAKGGYPMVSLYRDRGRSTRTVHRLVLLAFVGPEPEGAEACHRDGNPTNNALPNLYWGTHSENMHDAVRHGRNRQARRTTCPLGHPLEWPNLVPSTWWKHGHRQCRACHRERARASHFGSDFDASQADVALAMIRAEVGETHDETGYQVACLHGHRLAPPNLVESTWRKHGRRACRACHRERSSARHARRPFSVSAADEKYADIMAGVDRRLSTSVYASRSAALACCTDHG